MKSNLLYLDIFLADALENGAERRLVPGPAEFDDLLAASGS